MDRGNGSGAYVRVRTLREFRSVLGSARGLTAPGAPVAPRVDEVLVRSDGLSSGGWAVAEQVPRERPHLEEAEVLTVLGGRLQARLAPGDVDGVPAVAAEDVADRDAWGFVLVTMEHSHLERAAQRHNSALCADKPALRSHKRLPGDNATCLLAEDARMPLEEADDAACLALGSQFAMQKSLQGSMHTTMTNERTMVLRVPRCCCRSGLHDDQERAQAKQYGFQNVYLLSGDRGAAHHEGRSCHA